MKNTAKLSLIVAAFALTTLAGCASMSNSAVDNASQDSLQQTLIKGKTTKADVEAQFGKPGNTVVNGGVEEWIYSSASISASSFVTGRAPQRYLDIKFDQRGRVLSYSLTNM